MECATYFIPDKALFGCYPTQKSIEEYERLGVRYFIDLTDIDEKGIHKYKTQYTYIHYPIKDMKVPTNWKSFASFIIKISNIIGHLNIGEKLFLSCRGGHGRSGVVVACLLCYLYDISPEEGIKKTTLYHNMRLDMSDKWKRLGSPQTQIQKNFVKRFFKPLYIEKNNKNNFSYIFSCESDYPVYIPNIGKFLNAVSAFYALKNPSNKSYIESIQNSVDVSETEKIFLREPTTEIWENNKECFMYDILIYKYEQYLDFKMRLINTGLRPFLLESNDMSYEKIFLTSLMELRKNIYSLK